MISEELFLSEVIEDKEAPVRDSKKRERTRSALLDAACRVIAQKGPHGITIQDVTSAANVAPGTFYNYYTSIDLLFQDVAQALADCVVELADYAHDIERDPGARMGYLLRLMLKQARTENVWAVLMMRFVQYPRFPVYNALLSAVQRELVDGVNKGQFTVKANQASLDMVLGSVMLAIATVAKQQVDVVYEQEVASHILRGLGMVSQAAIVRAQRNFEA